MNDPLIHLTIKAEQVGEAIRTLIKTGHKKIQPWYPENNRGIINSILKPKQL